jgi:hypothetical protein
VVLESALALGLLGGSNLADYQTTRAALSRAGGVELSGFYGPQAQRMLPIKAALTVVETGAFVALRKHGHKRAAWVMVAGLVAVNVAASIHNGRARR